MLLHMMLFMSTMQLHCFTLDIYSYFQTLKVMVMNSVSKCMGCFDFHIFIAGSSGKVKHQNVQTEAVEIKDHHVQAKAIPKETSMLQQL